MQVSVVGPNPGAISGASEQPESPIPGVSEEEFARVASEIIVFVPHRSFEGVNSSISMAAGFWARWGMHFAPVSDEFGGEIAAVRAGMCRAFQDIAAANGNRIKFMVMIDNDEIINPLAPLALAFWDKEIVSGVVCSPSEYGGIKACFTIKDETGIARFPTLRYTQKMPSRGLRQVHSCGAGLICIRRDVIERIAEQGWVPFHIPEEERIGAWKTGVLKVGEDISFCRQAQKLGIPVYVDFSVRAPHLKIVPILWPEEYLDPEIDPETWKVDVRDYAHV